jgi:hypothetical protein
MRTPQPGHRETTSLSRVRVCTRTATRTVPTLNPDTSHANPDGNPDMRRRTVRDEEPGHPCDRCGLPGRQFVNHVAGGYAWCCAACWRQPTEPPLGPEHAE